MHLLISNCLPLSPLRKEAQHSPQKNLLTLPKEVLQQCLSFIHKGLRRTTLECLSTQWHNRLTPYNSSSPLFSRDKAIVFNVYGYLHLCDLKSLHITSNLYNQSVCKYLAEQSIQSILDLSQKSLNYSQKIFHCAKKPQPSENEDSYIEAENHQLKCDIKTLKMLLIAHKIHKATLDQALKSTLQLTFYPTTGEHSPITQCLQLFEYTLTPQSTPQFLTLFFNHYIKTPDWNKDAQAPAPEATELAFTHRSLSNHLIRMGSRRIIRALKQEVFCSELCSWPLFVQTVILEVHPKHLLFFFKNILSSSLRTDPELIKLALKQPIPPRFIEQFVKNFVPEQLFNREIVYDIVKQWPAKKRLSFIEKHRRHLPPSDPPIKGLFPQQPALLNFVLRNLSRPLFREKPAFLAPAFAQLSLPECCYLYSKLLPTQQQNIHIQHALAIALPLEPATLFWQYIATTPINTYMPHEEIDRSLIQKIRRDLPEHWRIRFICFALAAMDPPEDFSIQQKEHYQKFLGDMINMCCIGLSEEQLFVLLPNLHHSKWLSDDRFPQLDHEILLARISPTNTQKFIDFFQKEDPCFATTHASFMQRIKQYIFIHRMQAEGTKRH